MKGKQLKESEVILERNYEQADGFDVKLIAQDSCYIQMFVGESLGNGQLQYPTIMTMYHKDNENVVVNPIIINSNPEYENNDKLENLVRNPKKLAKIVKNMVKSSKPKR